MWVYYVRDKIKKERIQGTKGEDRQRQREIFFCTKKHDKKNFHPLAAWPDKLGLLISPPGLFKFSEGWGPGYTLVPNTNLAL